MQLRLLGPTELVIGDVPARLGGPRSRAVLVDLGLHAGRPIMTSQIIDDLWGESAPPSAAHTLETYISRLRKVLNLPGEPIVIARNGSGYMLNLDAPQVDALWFGQLAAKGRTALAEGDTQNAEDLLSSALALWRGPAFADVRFGLRYPRRHDCWRTSAWSFSKHSSKPAFLWAVTSRSSPTSSPR